jgi:DNA-binding CsgD family transcriptional regulator
VGTSAVVGLWPLVGRDAELQQMASALADPACHGAVISAGPGVGKSRLVREACAAAEAGGALTILARATASSASIPLGALAGVLPDEARSDDPLQLVRRTIDALRNRAGERSVVFAVDDAQLLDVVSAGLLLHLATAANVFVLATLRAGELPPDAIDALWKDAGARLMQLDRLSDVAIAEMVESGLGGPAEQETLQWVIDTSAGNPMFARELVLGAFDAGVLTARRGLWRLRGRPPVPASLTALITRRMQSLTPEQREPLELLALGEPLRVDELVELTSYEAVAEAEERGNVVVTGPVADSRVHLAQPLYGEVLRAQLPVLRVRALFLRLAETIQRRRPLAPDDALHAVRWLRETGAAIPANLLLDAAAAANLAGDPDLGADLAAMAVGSGAGLKATLLLARAHTIRKRFGEAEAVLAAAEDNAAGDELAIEYVSHRLHVLLWGLRRSDDAGALLDRAEAWSSDPAWIGQFRSSRLALAGFTDGFADRLDSIVGMLAQPGLDPEWSRQLHLSQLLALMGSGRVKEAQALVQRIRPQVPLRDKRDTYALSSMCTVGLEGGEDWADLEDYMSVVLREGVKAGDHEAAGIAAFTLGALEVERGRYRTARRWLAEAEAQLESHDTIDTIFCIRALEVRLSCAAGDIAGAQAALERVRAMSAGSGPRPPGQLRYAVAAEGYGARAVSEAAGAERFLQEAAHAEDPSLRSRLLYEAMRAGARPAAVAGELAELAARCDSRLVAARASHAAARAGRSAEALLEAGQQMADIGAELYAMEAAVDAAQQFLADGRTDSARRAATLARARHTDGEGVAAPVIDGLDGVATELTRREAQIATLASRGLTNQEIAAHLVLSVRTVETYVYRAMQKRGVDHRHDL